MNQAQEIAEALSQIVILGNWDIIPQIPREGDPDYNPYEEFMHEFELAIRCKAFALKALHEGPRRDLIG